MFVKDLRVTFPEDSATVVEVLERVEVAAAFFFFKDVESNEAVDEDAPAVFTCTLTSNTSWTDTVWVTVTTEASVLVISVLWEDFMVCDSEFVDESAPVTDTISESMQITDSKRDQMEDCCDCAMLNVDHRTPSGLDGT